MLPRLLQVDQLPICEDYYYHRQRLQPIPALPFPSPPINSLAQSFESHSQSSRTPPRRHPPGFSSRSSSRGTRILRVLARPQRTGPRITISRETLIVPEESQHLLFPRDRNTHGHCEAGTALPACFVCLPGSVHLVIHIPPCCQHVLSASRA